MRPGSWVIAATAFVASCTSLSGLSGSADDAGSSADAAPSADGAGADAPPNDAGDSGPVNLLGNPGFEDSLGSGCAGWSAVGATAVLSDISHTGSHSCLVCPTSQALQYFGLARHDTGSDAATSYYAEVWLRAPSTDPVTPGAGVVLYEALEDGGQTNHQGNIVPPSSSWSLSTVNATVRAGDKIEFEVHGFFPDGGCALVDDAALYAR